MSVGPRVAGAERSEPPASSAQTDRGPTALDPRHPVATPGSCRGNEPLCEALTPRDPPARPGRLRVGALAAGVGGRVGRVVGPMGVDLLGEGIDVPDDEGPRLEVI